MNTNINEQIKQSYELNQSNEQTKQCRIELQYVYLIQEREFVQSEKPIFKIGKTIQLNFSRFKQYPKGSIMIHHSTCFNCNTCEREIIQLFKTNYKQRLDIGTEYFEGDYKSMLRDILVISVNLWNQQIGIEEILTI